MDGLGRFFLLVNNNMDGLGRVFSLVNENMDGLGRVFLLVSNNLDSLGRVFLLVNNNVDDLGIGVANSTVKMESRLNLIECPYNQNRSLHTALGTI